uniref:beta-2-microglobulin-like n=1 Tax=Pristiophorus japonicus TaxID=55135 RepID=UPI00398F4AC0
MLKIAIFTSVLALCLANAPQVHVYTHTPPKEGESNVLLCHAKDFSPPNIQLELLENGIIIPNANQSDLSFETDWSFKLTTFVHFVPKNNVKYVCRVQHNGDSREFQLDSY